MARGRMISNSLGTSKKFAKLGEAGGEFAQALYMLLVTHADDWGRLEGDPFTVKHRVFPISPKSEDDFKAAIGAMVTVGLIQWYTAGEAKYIQIQGFDQHQVGLHKRTESKIPLPETSSSVPKVSAMFRNVPESSITTELNRTELKGREQKDPPTLPSVKNSPLRPPGEPDSISARAGKFCQLYRWTLYPEVQQVAYTPQQRVEVSDLDAARRLAMSYTDPQLEEMARFFLAIPEDRDRMLRNSKRTVTMLLNMAEPIAKKLWGKHAATA